MNFVKERCRESWGDKGTLNRGIIAVLGLLKHAHGSRIGGAALIIPFV